MKMHSDLIFVVLSFGLTKLMWGKQTEILFSVKLVLKCIKNLVVLVVGLEPVTFRTKDLSSVTVMACVTVTNIYLHGII